MGQFRSSHGAGVAAHTMCKVVRIVVKFEGESLEVTCRVGPELSDDRELNGVPNLWLDIYIALLRFADHDSGIVGNRCTFWIDRGELGDGGVIRPRTRIRPYYELAAMW